MTCKSNDKCIVRQLKYTTLVWETLDELHPEIGATGHFDISSLSLSLFPQANIKMFPKIQIVNACYVAKYDVQIPANSPLRITKHASTL